MKLVLNNPEYNVKVLTTIQNELQKCEEFYIAVAFITESGITPLLQNLKELEQKNVKGKILTTDYLAFSQPKALKRLNNLSNIEVRLYQVTDSYGFHPKGYIFKNTNYYNILIGSSNLTQKALTVNMEWNILTEYRENNEIVSDLSNSFIKYWNKSRNIDECIDEYEAYYNESNKHTYYPKKEIKDEFKPNSMQKQFIDNFLETIKTHTRGLLISATGTGKTYASAFALREINPRKILFLVHREQIAKQAMNSYKNVFKNRSYGLFTGTSKDYDADFIFSTIQTMSQEKYYSRYEKDEFDIIVIDEVHHAGAPSYQEIMNYFTPKFYLGMTGSPDRSDEFDIYDLFDHNIIYEIRLKKALEENILCDFHYFGINNPVDDNYLSEGYVDEIIENIEYYGFNGNRVKGLVFCNNVDNAKVLSDMFNMRGYNTISLSGNNTQDEREDAINRLVSDNIDNTLDYIFTVDIFNEGVDIIEINQIVMLRPTQSSIVFIQQLGRGLRKHSNKEYVVVLDFIGNFDTNYMIPIALSDDRTYNKDTIRKFMFDSNNLLPGASTISFDRISKEKIYHSIDNATINSISFLRNKYMNFKKKIGRIPLLIDFYNYDELDAMFIIKYMKEKLPSKKKAYPVLLSKLDKSFNNSLCEDEILYLEFLSLKIANGKRPHELIILRELIENRQISIYDVNNILENNYSLTDNALSIKSAIKILSVSYYKKMERTKYSRVKLLEVNNNILFIHENFRKLLENEIFKKFIYDIIDIGFKEYDLKYRNPSCTPFKLYEKYSREDVSRLLNWPENESTTIFGYRSVADFRGNLSCPMFVTYNKNEDISQSIQYEDKFIDNTTMYWMSKHNKTLESEDVKTIINYKDNNLKMYLFIKKSDSEDEQYFYYVGEVIPKEYIQTCDKLGNDIVRFTLKLNTSLRDDIYEYLVN